MWVKWKFVSVYFEIVLISTQDRCTVCVKQTIGSEIVMDLIRQVRVNLGVR
jgi:hypothetical protein